MQEFDDSPIRPCLIAFEGLDGSGKSTLARALAARSGARYMTTPSTTMRRYRQPIIDEYGSCQAARQLFYLSTVFAASAQIRAALATGESVVIDRYFLSTQAYAHFRGSQLGLDELAAGLTPAELTIYVDAPLELRRERVVRRGASPADIETLTASADRTLRELHLRRRALAVVGRLVVIDSGRHSIEACVQQILDARDAVLGASESAEP